MTPDDMFYLMVGIATVALILFLPTYWALKKFLGIDMRVYFFAAQAELIGAWYDRKERQDALKEDRPIQRTRV